MLHSGSNVWKAAALLLGQPEMLAGQASGQRFKQLGATNVLCVIHQSGQNLLDRCNGIAQGLGVGSTCKSGSAPSKGPACTQLTLSTPNAARWKIRFRAPW